MPESILGLGLLRIYHIVCFPDFPLPCLLGPLLLCSWSLPESCCIVGVACEGVTLCSWLTLRMWPQPSSDTVVFCFLFVIPSMFCICTPVFVVRCWHLKKSGLNYQKDLSGAALPTSPCKHRDRGQTSDFSEHPNEACTFGVLGQIS